MRKWWKDTNDPSGSFQACDTIAVCHNWRVQRTSQPLSLQTHRDNNGIVTALSSTPHQARGDKWEHKSQALLGASRSSVVPPGKSAVPWRWKRNSLMENNLQVILSFSVGKGGCRISVPVAVWAMTRSVPLLSALPRKGTEVSNNHCSILGASELQMEKERKSF